MITIKCSWATDKSAQKGYSGSWRSVSSFCRSFVVACRREDVANIRFCLLLAGRSVTEGEVEEMLESGNPSVFTQGVRSSESSQAATNDVRLVL